jgi:hypothetical protein
MSRESSVIKSIATDASDDDDDDDGPPAPVSKHAALIAMVMMFLKSDAGVDPMDETEIMRRLVDETKHRLMNEVPSAAATDSG